MVFMTFSIVNFHFSNTVAKCLALPPYSKKVAGSTLLCGVCIFSFNLLGSFLVLQVLQLPSTLLKHALVVNVKLSE